EVLLRGAGGGLGPDPVRRHPGLLDEVLGHRLTLRTGLVGPLPARGHQQRVEAEAEQPLALEDRPVEPAAQQAAHPAADHARAVATAPLSPLATNPPPTTPMPAWRACREPMVRPALPRRV